MAPVERCCTVPALRTKTASHTFDIAGFSRNLLVRTIKALSMRSLLAPRGVFCTLLLCTGMALGTAGFGTAALGQTSSNSAADRDMADRYSRAAQNGDDVAQFYLGSLYAQGVGRTQSDTEAFRWIEQSAMRGNAQAMLVAAGLTALGKGTPKDYIVSYKWAFLVAQGSQMADLKNGGRQLIGMLEPRMSADQVQSAKTQAYQFRAVASPVPRASVTNTPIATTAPAATAPASAAVPPTVVAPAPAAPSLQSTTPTGGPQPAPRVSETTTSPSQSPIAVEAQKHMSKEKVDRMMKNIPPEYRKRFGL